MGVHLEHMSTRSAHTVYFRNFIFGVEDSLVSTVGLLSGIAIANIPQRIILITGAVLIFVEAFSMGAGSFVSETSAEGYEHKTANQSKTGLLAASVMFGSYFLSGFIPLFPYLLFPVSWALNISIILSIIALFVLGIVGAKISKTNLWRNGLRMTLVGGLAIAVGVIAGSFV
jgi:VIT1/CCC1 family predicted Fe2+/Mn2+ transporter